LQNLLKKQRIKKSGAPQKQYSSKNIQNTQKVPLNQKPPFMKTPDCSQSEDSAKRNVYSKAGNVQTDNQTQKASVMQKVSTPEKFRLLKKLMSRVDLDGLRFQNPAAGLENNIADGKRGVGREKKFRFFDCGVARILVDEFEAHLREILQNKNINTKRSQLDFIDALFRDGRSRMQEDVDGKVSASVSPSRLIRPI
jgi:hypothetical protein